MGLEESPTSADRQSHPRLPPQIIQFNREKFMKLWEPLVNGFLGPVETLEA